MLQLAAELPSQHEILSSPKRCGWCPSVASDEYYSCTTAGMNPGKHVTGRSRRTNSNVSQMPYGLVFGMLHRHGVDTP